MRDDILDDDVATFPAGALLGLAFVAGQLGGRPEPARDAYRVAAAGRTPLAPEEVAGIAADCGLWVEIVAADHRLALGDFLLLRDAVGDEALVAWMDEAGTPVLGVPVADEDRIRVKTARAATVARGPTLLLRRGQEEAPGPERPPFDLWWFVRRIRRHRAATRWILFAACLVHLIGLLVPLVFAAMVDHVLPRGAGETLVTLSALAGVALVADYLLRVRRDRMIAWVAARVDAQTAEETFRHLLSLPLPFFHAVRAGVIARNLRLTEDVREFLTGPAVEAAIKLLALPIASLALLYLSWKLFLVVLVAGVLLGLCLTRAWKPYREELEQLTKLEGIRQATAVETIHGATTVKALALEPVLHRRWKALSAEIAASRERLARIGTDTGARLDLIQHMADLAIIALGIYFVMDGDALTVGGLIAFKMIAAQVVEPMIHAANLAQESQTAKRQLELLREIMDAEPEPTPREGAAVAMPQLTGGFRFDWVQFTYPGTTAPAAVVNGIDVPTPGPDGCVVAIVGESGSGKSTVAKLLLALYRPQQGRISFAVAPDEPGGNERWVDSRDLHPRALRRSLAIVVQDNQFFQGSLRENLLMATEGLPPSEARIEEALATACATDFVSALPRGLETTLDEGAANLSGGQRQRLAIARALLRDPPILVLDEATSALDVETESIFRDNMRHFARGRVLLVVAHRLSTIAEADVIMVMRDGDIIESDTHEELLAMGGAYAAMWAAQQVRRAEDGEDGP